MILCKTPPPLDGSHFIGAAKLPNGQWIVGEVSWNPPFGWNWEAHPEWSPDLAPVAWAPMPKPPKE